MALKMSVFTWIQEEATLGKSGKWLNRRMEGTPDNDLFLESIKLYFKKFVLQKLLWFRNSFYCGHIENISQVIIRNSCGPVLFMPDHTMTHDLDELVLL